VLVVAAVVHLTPQAVQVVLVAAVKVAIATQIYQLQVQQTLAVVVAALVMLRHKVHLLAQQVAQVSSLLNTPTRSLSLTPVVA
jgi:hypothetical protein